MAPVAAPRLRVNGRAVFKALVSVALLFFAITLFERIWEQGHGGLGGIGARFDTAEEANLPTWFSAFLLLAGGVLCALIGWVRRAAGQAWAGRWMVLGAAFVYLSADEAGQIHEYTVRPLKRAIERGLGVGGTPARIIAVAVVVSVLAGFAAAYWPWLRAQPRTARRLILGAGVLYVMGALGLEVVSRFYEVAGGSRSSLFDGVLSATEELLEMTGAALFVSTLLGYVPAVTVELRGRPREDVADMGAASASEHKAGRSDADHQRRQGTNLRRQRSAT